MNDSKEKLFKYCEDNNFPLTLSVLDEVGDGVFNLFEWLEKLDKKLCREYTAAFKSRGKDKEHKEADIFQSADILVLLQIKPAGTNMYDHVWKFVDNLMQKNNGQEDMPPNPLMNGLRRDEQTKKSFQYLIVEGLTTMLSRECFKGTEICRDLDGHNEGYWKIYCVRSKYRTGTWNKDLTVKIGK